MYMLILHLLRLLARALVEFPTVVSGNWISVLLPVIVFLAKEGRTLRVGGWQGMREHVQRDAWVLLGAYFLLFGWAVIQTIYKDHMYLVDRSRTLARSLSTQQKTNEAQLQQTKNALGSALTDLKVQCGIKDGMNSALETQNRDQQGTINNCQTQALKLLVPPKWKTSFRLIGGHDDTLGPSRRYEVLMLTNKPVFPVMLQVVCARNITSIHASVLGDTGTTMLKTPKQISPANYEISILNPPWTPDAPIVTSLTLGGIGKDSELPCSFQMNER